MSLATLLSLYLTLNLCVAVSYGLLKIVAWLAGSRLGAGAELRLHYALLVACLLLGLAQPFGGRRTFFQPPVKVWSAQSLRSFATDQVRPGGYLALPPRLAARPIDAGQAGTALLALFFVALAAGLWRLGRDVRGLAALRRGAFVIREVGGVSILGSDRVAVPLSYWLPGRSCVVVPNRLLARPRDARMAIAHELQHHRQRDTRWVYALWLLKTLCAPNPFVFPWERWISRLQEFACDETLVDRSKVESRQYARCLIEVAQSALDPGRAPVCATGLAFRVEGNLLKKRIEKMLSGKKQGLTRSFTFSIGTFLVAALGATAFASQGLVQDRRVSLADARAMAARAQSGSPFPVVVNDLVVRELNRYLGTAEGRDFMRKSLSRMQSYRPAVEAKIAEYAMPTELVAIPIVESGYQNLGPRQEHPGWGAGLWMFIEQTARNYGLEVDSQVDQRLDVGLETDAAMRYLKANELRFKDWLLAVMAYNMGENAVEKAIDETGSRDAWTLTRQGYQNDENYLARVMAAVIILRNPQSVQ